MGRVSNIALDLIEIADRHAAPAAIGRSFLAALKPLGARAIFARANPAGGPACEHVYSRISPAGWEDLYAEPRYAGVNFLNRTLARRADAFAWSESDIRPGAERELFRALRDFNISDGLAVPAYGPNGYVGITSIAFERMEELAPGERSAIAIAALVLHHRMCDLRLSAGHPQARLTPRERDCLAFLAEGNTDADVATKLGIGETTVVTHILNARRKLGARNRTHAVALALAMGLL